MRRRRPKCGGARRCAAGRGPPPLLWRVAQVDRYKQLLLKQRDIMILLTQRLNERDEQIVALQDELDACVA